jgi:hypothetical protein
MFRPIVLIAAIAALGAGPALAADEVVEVPVQAQQQQQQPATTTPRHCWKENPFNEFRDCVNAATRDPNAKIRMA